MNDLDIDLSELDRPSWALHQPYTDQAIANMLSGDLEGQLAWTPNMGWLVWDERGWWEPHGPKWVGAGGPRQRYAAKGAEWVARMTDCAANDRHGITPKDIKAARMAVEQTARIQSWHDTALAEHGEDQETWNQRSRAGTLNCGTSTLIWGEDPRPAIVPTTPEISNHNHSGIDIDNIDWELHDSLVAEGATPEGMIGAILDWSEAQHIDECLWLNFLLETHGTQTEDLTNVDYIWRLWGAAIYGLSTTMIGELVHVLTGTGSNGKTVECRTLKSLLGTYWAEGPSELIVVSTNGKQSGADSLWRFHASRLFFFNELPADRFNIATIKQLASGETIMTNRKYADQADFVNTGLVLAHANVQPSVPTASDGGFWRRMRLMEYPHTVPPERRDTAIAHGFIEAGRDVELITTWAVAAATRCHLASSYGTWLVPSVAMDAKLGQYRSEQDPVTAWVEEFVEHRTDRLDLHEAEFDLSLFEAWKQYSNWVEAQNRRPLSSTKFEAQFLAHPMCAGRVEVYKVNHVAFVKGVRSTAPSTTMTDYANRN